MIRFSCLGSGSAGNSTYLNVDGHQFLVDAGFSRKELTKRLNAIGRDISDIEFVLYSHRHKDHWNPKTLTDKPDLTPLLSPEANTIKQGDFLTITSFPLSHDDPCLGFTVQDDSGNKIAIISDTGCVSEEALGYLFDCSAILIECNYDIDKLANDCPYGEERTLRIASNDGHLANEDAAAVVKMVAGPELKYIVPLHLSSCNNDPVLVQFEMDSKQTGAEVIISNQKYPTKMITIL